VRGEFQFSFLALGKTSCSSAISASSSAEASSSSAAASCISSSSFVVGVHVFRSFVFGFCVDFLSRYRLRIFCSVRSRSHLGHLDLWISFSVVSRGFRYDVCDPCCCDSLSQCFCSYFNRLQWVDGHIVHFSHQFDRLYIGCLPLDRGDSVVLDRVHSDSWLLICIHRLDYFHLYQSCWYRSCHPITIVVVTLYDNVDKTSKN
jgi:hypothetical protein